MSGQEQIEAEIAELSNELVQHIRGKHSAVAMGALMNLVMTVAQNVPSPAFRGHMSHSFRNIADQLEQMGRRHEQH